MELPEYIPIEKLKLIGCFEDVTFHPQVQQYGPDGPYILEIGIMPEFYSFGYVKMVMAGLVKPEDFFIFLIIPKIKPAHYKNNQVLKVISILSGIPENNVMESINRMVKANMLSSCKEPNYAKENGLPEDTTFYYRRYMDMGTFNFMFPSDFVENKVQEILALDI